MENGREKKPNQPNKNNTKRNGVRRGEAISEPQPGQASRSGEDSSALTLQYLVLRNRD